MKISQTFPRRFARGSDLTQRVLFEQSPRSRHHQGNHPGRAAPQRPSGQEICSLVCGNAPRRDPHPAPRTPDRRNPGR